MKLNLITGKIKCPLPIQASEFIDRRIKLIKNLKVDNSKSPFVILRSALKTFSAPDVPHNFRQCSHFRYLTGCLEPNSCLVLNGSKSTLFVHAKSQHEKLWEGEGTSTESLKVQGGFDELLPLSELTSYVARELTPDSVLAADTRKFGNQDVQSLINAFPGQRMKLFNGIDECRWIKSDAEVENMRHVVKIGSESINSMIQNAKDVKNESIFVGFLEFEMRRRGANTQAYPPVVASGRKANIIHYIDSNQEIEAGSCVLVDAGADYNGYVSDITRCFPISGRFSSPQQELYQALNEIHGECLEYVKNVRPLKLNELFFHMLATMANTLSSIAFFSRPLSDEEAIQACEKLCEHHISHYLGMDVHDTPSISRTVDIPQNVIITVEPGIYVQHNNPLVRNEFKGVGFRIEDDVLLTDTGAEILSSSCVRSANSIESLMS